MDTFIGTILLWAPTFAPRGWQFCYGQLLPISQYQALFSLIGTTYGGDGRTTFALPDLRGRVPVGVGQGAGTSNYPLGARKGVESVQLTTDNLAAHSHMATIGGSSFVKVSDQEGTESVPGTNGATTLGAGVFQSRGVESFNNETPNVTLNTGGGSTGDVTIGQTGANAPVNVVQPSLGMNYIICLEGIYPPRD